MKDKAKIIFLSIAIIILGAGIFVDYSDSQSIRIVLISALFGICLQSLFGLLKR